MKRSKLHIVPLPGAALEAIANAAAFRLGDHVREVFQIEVLTSGSCAGGLYVSVLW